MISHGLLVDASVAVTAQLRATEPRRHFVDVGASAHLPFLRRRPLVELGGNDSMHTR
jgi:hypothetical protein